MGTAQSVESLEQLTTVWRAAVLDRNPEADVRDLPGLAVRWADCRFAFWNCVALTGTGADAALVEQRLCRAADLMRAKQHPGYLLVFEDLLGEEARAALEEMNLLEIADRFPDEMSGGQQQRVAIARALVGDRRLVLADEPTGALDSETGEAVLALLRNRCDQGAAGVMVTHEPRYAAWADRVVFLRDGSIVDQTLTAGADSLLAAGGAE